MTAKSHISGLCKLYTIYEGIPESFFDETDVDSNFYQKILDILQTGSRIVRLSLCPTNFYLQSKSLILRREKPTKIHSRLGSSHYKERTSMNFEQIASVSEAI